MISATMAHALRALRTIAKQGQISSRAIAEIEDLPARFILQVLKNLVSARILKSDRGPRGGYSLTRPAEEISYLEILTAIDQPIRFDYPDHLPAEMVDAIRGPLERGVEQLNTQMQLLKLSDLLGPKSKPKTERPG